MTKCGWPLSFGDKQSLKPRNIQSLSEILHIGTSQLQDAYGEDHFFPDRAKLIENPPRDPYDFIACG